MLNLNSLILFTDRPKELTEFYKKVLAKKVAWSGGGFNGFEIGDGMLMIGPHDKVHGKNNNPERLIFNLETKDVKTEFERIKKLGAKVIAEPYQPPMDDGEELIATLADPDNNYFQLVSPME